MIKYAIVFLAIFQNGCSSRVDFPQVEQIDYLPSLSCQYVGEISSKLEESVMFFFVTKRQLETIYENQLNERAKKLGGTLIYTGDSFGRKIPYTYKSL